MSIMGSSNKVLQLIKGRVSAIRRHQSVTFIDIYDPFKNKTIQVKANPLVHTEIGGRGSSIIACVDINDENNLESIQFQNIAQVQPS